MLVPSPFITCMTKAGSVRASSSAMNCGMPSSSRMPCDWRWRVELKTMRPSGRNCGEMSFTVAGSGSVFGLTTGVKAAVAITYCHRRHDGALVWSMFAASGPRMANRMVLPSAEALTSLMS